MDRKYISQTFNSNRSIIAPRSKSSMQRACALSCLKQGYTLIKNPGYSNDDKVALNIIQQIGVQITEKDNNILCYRPKNLFFSNSQINCGESGLSIRMFGCILAQFSQCFTLNGQGSLTKRPLNFFSETLPIFGKKVQSKNGLVPIEICGNYKFNSCTVDGSLSSQYISGLLLLLAQNASLNKYITVNNPTSLPYIDLTIQMLNQFGYNIHHQNYQKYSFDSYNDNYNKPIIEYEVESDWSGVAFLAVLSAIHSPFVIKNLSFSSVQADKAILKCLELAGAQIEISGNNLFVKKNKILKGFEFDATHCPDLFPPLVALACFCQGSSVILGANRLIHKESSRGQTLQQEFEKIGCEIIIQKNELVINPPTNFICPPNLRFNSHDDHRIAMAVAIAAVNLACPFIIENSQAVNKSYPDFFKHLTHLGYNFY